MDPGLSEKRHYYYFQTHAAGLNHYVIWKAIAANIIIVHAQSQDAPVKSMGD